MKTNRFQKILLAGIALLSVEACLSAAPLTWFPGPDLYYTRSGAATTVVSGGNNLLIGGDSTGVQELAATNISWTYKQAFSSTAIAPGVAGNGDPITVYGGSDGTSSTSTVIAYSPSGDPTSPLPSMNVARSYLGYASDKNGNAYAFGGLDASGNPLASAERLNLGNNNPTWTNITSLPAARYNFPAVFDRTNYIYIFGGLTDTTSKIESATVLRYSVSGKSWSNMASMPVAVAGSAAAFGADGKIFVVGGTSGGVSTNVVQVYNPAANAWTISTPLPEGLSLAAMGVDSLGRLIVMGGVDTNGYDVSDSWRSQQLGVADVAPAFTQYPATNAIYAATYTSTISTSGNPQPVYLLASGPTNMTVDLYSGVITWTPLGADQIGDIPVTIQATNFAGSTNWSFTITVPPPPPIIPTNVTVAAVTETSVTLTWDPESPLVGPVTYSVYERHVAFSHGSSSAYYVLLSSNLPSPSVTIGGFAVGSSHTYAVTAAAAGYPPSARSQGISITTLSPQPAANFRVTALTSTSTSLAWDPSPGPVQIASYSLTDEIYYSPLSGAIETNVTGITGTSISISGQTPGTQHYYYLYAHDAAGNSSAEVILGAFNPVPTPASLAGPTLMATGGFQFTVQANAVQTTLVQATANLADPKSWVTIATNPPGSTVTFTDTTASQFPTRNYRVVSP